MQVRALTIIVLTGFVLAACVDRPTPTALDDIPSLSVLASSDGNANPHFYFLPPLGPDPSDTGEFDATLKPVVEIEDPEEEEVIATFTMETGSGSETIRLDEDQEHYVVNWHTREFDLSTDRIYRIRVLVAGTELGRMDVNPVSTGGELRRADTGESVALLAGRTLPIKFRIEQGAVFVVGPEGADVVAAGGRVSVSVPPGAIDEELGITVVPVSGAPPRPELLAATMFDIGPQGARFASPVRLTIQYNPDLFPPEVDQSSLGLFRFIEGVLDEVRGSAVNVGERSVSGDVYGFSTFGAAFIEHTGKESQGYGAFNGIRNGRYHTGIDIGGTRKDIVRAAVGGRVVKISGLARDGGGRETVYVWEDKNDNGRFDPGEEERISTGRERNNHGLGMTIIIEHEDASTEWYTLYAHLDAIRKDIYEGVIKGQQPSVRAGDAIGLMGHSRYAERLDRAIHLHFEAKTEPSLGSLGSNGSIYWGYTPDRPGPYGYIDPLTVLRPPPAPTVGQTIPIRIVGEELATTWRDPFDESICTSDEPNRGINIFAGPGATYSILGWTGGGDGQRFIADATVLSTEPGDNVEGRLWYRIPLPHQRGPSHGWLPAEKGDGTPLVEEETDVVVVRVKRDEVLRRTAAGDKTVYVSGEQKQDVFAWSGQSYVRRRSTIVSGVLWHEVHLPKVYFDDPENTDKCAPLGDNAVGDISSAWLPDDAVEVSEGSLPQHYTRIDLGGLPGGGQSAANDVNDRGQVVGWSYDGIGDRLAVMWQDGAIIRLDEPRSTAWRVNNKGLVVGNTSLGAVTWQDGTKMSLGGSSAQGVNDFGHVVGVSRRADEVHRAVLWKDGEMIDLGTLGGQASQAAGINDMGQVVGMAHSVDGRYHAFLWENGQMSDLGTLAWASSYAWTINNAGQVVGGVEDAQGNWRAFVWHKTTGLRLLEIPGAAESWAVGINESGQIVGDFRPSGMPPDGYPWQPFLWENGAVTVLDPLDGFSGAQAWSINSEGVIAGASWRSGEGLRATAWRPDR